MDFMKRIIGLVIAAVLLAAQLTMTGSAAASSSGAAAAPSPAVGAKVIPGRYIVTLRPGIAINGPSAMSGLKPRFVYHSVLNGFAADLTPAQLAALSRRPDVAAIEPDQVATIDTTQTMDSSGQPWGLDRIDQRNLPLSRTYTYNSTGAGVHAYIIDTGIQTSNADFGGRASVAFDALGGNGQDCNGHGTHVSGTVGGRTYGVAKGVTLHAVRVLDCNGSGSFSGVIAGMDFVASNHIAPAVANMSLGGGFSSAVNSAVTRMTNSGVFLAVAAGNENQNACNVSPASAPSAYTTAASDISDRRASFSNFGSCVDGYAPGVSIKSDWLNGTTNTISGTSMATPHVTGVGALYKATFGDASAATVANFINTNATTNVITGNPSGTPNRLLFKSTL
jgi:subtilisin family serine protease